MTDTYNGWTNRETWATALHIDNDQGLHNYRNEMTKEAATEEAYEPFTKRQAEVYCLETNLRAWVEELHNDVFNPEQPPAQELLNMFNDIGSLWRVNWREIAENWLSGYEAAA